MYNVKKLFPILLFFFIFFPLSSHALDKNAVFYVGVGTNSASRYLTLNDQQATEGVSITHTTGSYPNGLAVFITNSSFTQGAKYVLNANYTIETYYRYALPNNWLSVGTWSNPNDTVGTSTVIINSQTSCGMNCFRSNVTFTGEWTQPWNTTAIIAFSQFDASNLVSYFKLNTFTTTKVADNSDVVNSVNQNTNLIINNNNQNTEIINDSLIDINDTLSDSTTDNNLASRFLNLFSHNDHALASIVTAPINFLNSLDDNCQPITLPISLGGGNGCGGLPVCVNQTFSKNATLQCGDTLFWNKSEVSTFRAFWNVLFGGALIYLFGFKLFKTINRALDPFVDDINGLEV